MFREEIIKLLEDLKVRRVRAQGNEIRFCCPFHKDKTPSASLNIESGLFNCFGCQAKGTLESFIKRLGGTVDKEILSRFFPSKENVKEKVEKVLQFKEKEETFIEEDVLRLFRFRHSYVLKRGFTEEILKKFEIGYSKEYKRITFPIRNETSKLVGVIGRTVNNSIPKYKILFPGKGFMKSKYLYGLHLIKEQIQLLVLVEGHLDVVRAFQYNFPFVVALQGNSLGKTQQRKLVSRVDRVIIAMDNDEVGKKAAKAIEFNLKNQIRKIDFFKYPTGKKDLADLTKEEMEVGISTA